MGWWDTSREAFPLTWRHGVDHLRIRQPRALVSVSESYHGPTVVLSPGYVAVRTMLGSPWSFIAESAD